MSIDPKFVELTAGVLIFIVIKYTRKSIRLTGRSSVEELKRTGKLLVNPTTATPTVG